MGREFAEVPDLKEKIKRYTEGDLEVQLKPSHELELLLRQQERTERSITKQWMGGHFAEKETPPIVCILPGGMAYGAAIAIAFFKACIATGFTAQLYAGRSAPTMVQSMLHVGYSIEEIQFYISNFDFRWLLSDVAKLREGKLISSAKLQKHFLRFASEEDPLLNGIEFAPHRSPIGFNNGFVSTNKSTGASELILSGSMCDAALASSAFPFVFPAMELPYGHYIDGEMNPDDPILHINALFAGAPTILKISTNDTPMVNAIRQIMVGKIDEGNLNFENQVIEINLSTIKPRFARYQFNSPNVAGYIDEIEHMITHELVSNDFFATMPY